MGFYDLPKVKIPKEIKPVKLSYKIAKERFYVSLEKKQQLLKQLKNTQADIDKYYNTMRSHDKIEL